MYTCITYILSYTYMTEATLFVGVSCFQVITFSQHYSLTTKVLYFNRHTLFFRYPNSLVSHKTSCLVHSVCNCVFIFTLWYYNCLWNHKIEMSYLMVNCQIPITSKTCFFVNVNSLMGLYYNSCTMNIFYLSICYTI